MNKQDISVQLYTTRKFQPYPSILNFIKESGVSNSAESKAFISPIFIDYQVLVI